MHVKVQSFVAFFFFFLFLDGLSYHCNLIEDKVQVEKVGIQIMHFVGSGIRNGKN